jgi:hypothetical protein
MGGGKALLDAFCARSCADQQSHDVYLDNCNPGTLQFYHNNGIRTLRRRRHRCSALMVRLQADVTDSDARSEKPDCH